MSYDKIIYMNAIGTSIHNRTVHEYLQSIQEQSSNVEVRSLRSGPTHLGYRSYEAAVIPGLLCQARKAEAEGASGFIIGCFLDPGIEAAREISNQMVITGAGHASITVAQGLDLGFSVLVLHDRTVKKAMRLVRNYGSEGQMASVRHIGVSATDAQSFETRSCVLDSLVEGAERAVRLDGAECVILGCTFLQSFSDDLQAALEVPVIEPIASSLKVAEWLISLRSTFRWRWRGLNSGAVPPPEELAEAFGWAGGAEKGVGFQESGNSGCEGGEHVR